MWCKIWRWGWTRKFFESLWFFISLFDVLLRIIETFLMDVFTLDFKCKCLCWMKMHLSCSCYLLPMVDFKGIDNFNVLQLENENWKHCVVIFTFKKTRILAYFKSLYNVWVERKCIWTIIVIFVHGWFQKNM
jgi:hypothetical protein